VNNRYLNVFRTGLLIGDVSPYGGFRNGSQAAHVITATPKTGQPRFEPRKFASQFVRREPLELRGKMCGSQARVGLHEQVNVVGPYFQRVNFGLQFLGFLVEKLPQSLFDFPDKHRLSIFRAPNKVILERVKSARADSISGVHHATSVAQKLDIRKKTNRRTAFLYPLKRAVPCGF
jgi:hypothetical protein